MKTFYMRPELAVELFRENDVIATSDNQEDDLSIENPSNPTDFNEGGNEA